MATAILLQRKHQFKVLHFQTRESLVPERSTLMTVKFDRGAIGKCYLQLHKSWEKNGTNMGTPGADPPPPGGPLSHQMSRDYNLKVSVSVYS